MAMMRNVMQSEEAKHIQIDVVDCYFLCLVRLLIDTAMYDSIYDTIYDLVEPDPATETRVTIAVHGFTESTYPFKELCPVALPLW